MDTSAYHEAGHAYMAMYVGARVRSITIDPEAGSGPDRSGDTHVEWNLSGWTKPQFAENSVRVALAGPAVEMIYTGDPYHPGAVQEWADDWEEAVVRAARLRKTHRDILEYLEDTTRELIAMLRQHRHWSPVAALADHLLAHETMETWEIEGVVRHWLR